MTLSEETILAGIKSLERRNARVLIPTIRRMIPVLPLAPMMLCVGHWVLPNVRFQKRWMAMTLSEAAHSLIDPNECDSCGEDIPSIETGIKTLDHCDKSKRPCGHHCNHVWSHERSAAGADGKRRRKLHGVI